MFVCIQQFKMAPLVQYLLDKVLPAITLVV